jgi:ABC-type lipopolysaccharide export system ATPase subunit
MDSARRSDVTVTENLKIMWTRRTKQQHDEEIVQTEEFSHLFSSLNINTVIKSRGVRLVGNVARTRNQDIRIKFG